MSVDLGRLSELAVTYGVDFLGALVVGAAGWWAAAFADRVTHRALLAARHMDVTVAAFLSSLARYAVLVVSFLIILQVMGIQATSLVAVLGAASLAIGLALQGTLSNMAAGVMLLLFRPFRIGDDIQVAGQSGTVRDLNLFMTELVNGGVQILIPNGQIWGAAIINRTTYGTEGVSSLTVVVSVALSKNPQSVCEELLDMLPRQPGVLAAPAPSVTVTKLTDLAAEITITASVRNETADSVKAALLRQAMILVSSAEPNLSISAAK